MAFFVLVCLVGMCRKMHVYLCAYVWNECSAAVLLICMQIICHFHVITPLSSSLSLSLSLSLSPNSTLADSAESIALQSSDPGGMTQHLIRKREGV